jgi:hypothetical protein
MVFMPIDTIILYVAGRNVRIKSTIYEGMVK